MESHELRLKRILDKGESPFEEAIAEANKGRDDFLRYVISQPLDKEVLSSFWGQYHNANPHTLDIIVEGNWLDEQLKNHLVNSVFFNSYFDRKGFNGKWDKVMVTWAINNGYKNIYPLEQKRHADEAVIEGNLEYLRFFTAVGIISNYIDPRTGKILEERKALVAYENPSYPYPRYSLTKRPIIELEQAGNRCNPKADYLPVVRYDGLYYEQSMSNICGTFYFYEPESTNLLDLGKYLIAANKIHAIHLLTGNTDPLTSQTSRALLRYPFYRNNMMVKGRFTPDPSEYQTALNFISRVLQTEADVITYQLPKTDDNEPVNSLFQTKTKYIGFKYYGKTDYLDQSICVLAREKGYNTVILQREIGERRVVTEILDTRSRAESYKNICTGYEVDLNSSKAYPAIWFTEQGFVNIA